MCSIQLITIPLAAWSKGRMQEAALDFVFIFGLLGAILGTYGAGETFFTLKGELEAVFAGLRVKKASYEAVKNNPSYHPGRCAAVSIDGVEVGTMDSTKLIGAFSEYSEIHSQENQENCHYNI